MTASAPVRAVLALLAVAALWDAPAAVAQASAPPPSAAAQAPAAPLYAVEFRTGPGWVAGKPANEQEHFREHSANLRKLREQGALAIGARYADKGFIVLAAESEAAARAMIDADPAVRHGTFVYELHEFAVFYGGSVQPRARGR